MKRYPSRLLSVFLLPLLLLGCFLVICPIPAKAQIAREPSLAVSPAVLELGLKPGQTKRLSIRLVNQAGLPSPISAKVRSLTPLEPTPKTEQARRFNASQWVTIKEPHFILRGSEERSINIEVSVPKNAEPGGHYATLVFQPLVERTAASSERINIQAELGALLFITVTGEVHELLDVKHFAVPMLSSKRTTPFTLQLHNSGNVHILPRTTLTVKKGGTLILEQVLHPEVILPNTFKEFEASWLPTAWGRYTVESRTVFGSANTVITTPAQTIWVGPPWYATIALLAVLSLIILSMGKKKTVLLFIRTFIRN